MVMYVSRMYLNECWLFGRLMKIEDGGGREDEQE